ncbi:MAG: hypothetical protein LAP61_08190 [Acidobacteriia bacterium]|nr:hypothetical protein [Terriglobia bacterium]
MNTSLLKRPSAFVPLAMSLAALTLLLVYVAMFGNAHPADDAEVHDERGPARIFQLLLAAQLPIIAFFAIKWLPRAPKEGLIVLVLQAGAGIAAIATVLFLEQ